MKGGSYMSPVLAAAAQQAPILGSLLFPLIVLVILYFMLIRPQKKKEKQIKEMRAALKVGDKVITIGGLNGKVEKISDDKITLDLGNKNSIIIEKWAIGSSESTN